MDTGFLSFLAEPWFVIPWNAIGLLGAAWVLYDVYFVNKQVNGAVKWAWPIIVFFFSIIGLALYWWTMPPAKHRGRGRRKRKEAAPRIRQRAF